MTKSKSRRIAAAGLVGVSLVATSLIATGETAVAKSTPQATNCSIQPDDNWPSWVQGRPKGINPLTTSHIYMWHDSNGWHIRATHRTTNKRTFSGQLTTRGKFKKVHAVRLEKGDQFKVSKDGHSVTFLFKNYGYIDGVDFRTTCAPSIGVAFQSDGRTAPPSKIVIGNNGVHPRSDPFTISRT